MLILSDYIVSKMFSVVEFCGDDNGSTNEVAVVPTLWLHKNDRKCYWPEKTGRTSFGNFIKNKTPYQKNWPTYKLFKVHCKVGKLLFLFNKQTCYQSY